VPVYDANGRLETVAGSGGRNNLLADNTGKGNKRWDGADENPACDHNQWMRNRFRTVNRPCVR
jgi:hypothetical protein